MKTHASMTYTEIDSPIGRLLIHGTDRGVSGILMTRNGKFDKKQSAWRRDDERWREVAAQLRDYFSGNRREFDFPLDVQGTEFQRKVWNALSTIPFGRTVSYGDIARKIGNPKAVRAVGLANGRNPVAVVVPCHRVIGSDGSLTGYGGGLDRKKILLELEGCAFAR